MRLMRAIFTLAASAVAFAVMTSPATAQTPAPGCRAAPPAELIGQPPDLDYELADTGGLNVVLVHRFGPTTLSDRSCLPDPEQGALQVVVNYGVTNDTPPEEHARELVWSATLRADVNRNPEAFPLINVEAFSVNGMPGAEALSHDVTVSGARVFRYGLIFVFPDGAKGLLGATGPSEQFEALRPSLRRIAEGVRPRRNSQEMQQDLIGAAEDMLARLRRPILNQAIDACLTTARDDAIARATASGFPPFEPQPGPGDQIWHASAAPADDSAMITMGVTEGPSSLLAGRRSLKCSIVAASGFEHLFRQEFDARFPGQGDQRTFTLSGGQVGGSAIVLGPRSGMGRAAFNSEARGVAIAIEITSLN